jgi:hypothetical protein
MKLYTESTLCNKTLQTLRNFSSYGCRNRLPPADPPHIGANLHPDRQSTAHFLVNCCFSKSHGEITAKPSFWLGGRPESWHVPSQGCSSREALYQQMWVFKEINLVILRWEETGQPVRWPMPESLPVKVWALERGALGLNHIMGSRAVEGISLRLLVSVDSLVGLLAKPACTK